MIYYLIAALLLCAAAIPQGPARRVAGWWAVILLLAFGGLRFEVGTDWDSYLDVFNAIRVGDDFSELREENGFLLFISFFQLFSSSYGGFIFTLFGIAFALKLFAIRRFQADINVSLIVYFFSVFLIYDINGLRQGLAMGFVLCAGWFAVQSRVMPYMAAMALAVGVHTVALIALPIYWAAKVNWYNRQALRNQYLIAATAIIIAYMLSLLLATTDATTYLDLISLTDRYNHYVDNFDSKFSPLGLGSLQRIFILGLALYMQDRLVGSKRIAALLVNTYLIATLIFFGLSFNIEFMARVSFYYKVFDIILISIIFKSLKSGAQTVLFLALLGALLFGSLSQIMSIPDGGLTPYKSQLFQ